MALSNDLVSQFAKMANNKPETKKEDTVYGTIESDGAKLYVRIDGTPEGSPATPVISTTDVKDGDRVTVTIKNHNAVVTGNLTKPAANLFTDIAVTEGEGEHQVTTNTSLRDIGSLMAGKIVAQRIEVNDLIAKKANISDLSVTNARVENLSATKANISDLSVTNAKVDNLSATKANITDLNATNISVGELEAKYAEIDTAVINDLRAENGTIVNLKSAFADIDFANIGNVAMENFYANSGLIDNVVVGDQTITGSLVGVTISGDLIAGNTIMADKLVIKGDDGLYYKLNYEGGAISGDRVVETTYFRVDFDSSSLKYVNSNITIDPQTGSALNGVFTTENHQVYQTTDVYGKPLYYCVVETLAEWTSWAENQLHGSNIVANSITAEKLSVHDLVAFDATIGCFNVSRVDEYWRVMYVAGAYHNSGNKINEMDGTIVKDAFTVDGDQVYTGTDENGNQIYYCVNSAGAIYSGVKESVGNSTKGIYMDSDGQFNFGDNTNFIRYYKDESGAYKLAVSAESVMYKLNGTSRSLAEIGAMAEWVKIGTYELDSYTLGEPFDPAYTTIDIASGVKVGNYRPNDTTNLPVYRTTDIDGTVVYYIENGGNYQQLFRDYEPCIELGEGDSNFRLVITNTRIMFLEGTEVPAHIDNQTLHIENASIENELQIGGFIWKKRDNGNVGLLWKGGVS